MSVTICSVAALFVLLAPSVEAHGWIQAPLARHLCNGDQVKWSVSDSGGNAACGMEDAGKNPYGGIANLCGDPFESDKACIPGRFEKMPCDPQETYQQGGIMRTQVDIAANHGGFWEISICDSTEISQECFDKNKLLTVEHGIEQWHIMDRKIDNPNNKNPDSYFMDWQLPADLACEHCVVQWTWWTAHNCVYPCDEAVCGFYANRNNFIVRPGEPDFKVGVCETKFPAREQQPQVFRNCADIRIEGNGSGGSKTPAEPTSADRATAPQPAPAAGSVPEQPMLTEEPDSTPMEQDSAVESVPEQPMTTKEPASTPMEQVPTESEPKETQQLDTPTFGTSLAQWMAYRWPTNARRMLMNSGTVKEVDDALADIGGAGNAMACSDHRVTQVLLKLNKLRVEADVPALGCSNRATGAAENFAEFLCERSELTYHSANNCHLAALGEECLQVVADGDSETPLASISVSDLQALEEASYTVAGVGHFTCKGRTYWTLLLG